MFLLQYQFILENFNGMLEVIETLLLKILRAIVCKCVTEKSYLSCIVILVGYLDIGASTTFVPIF